MRRLSCSIAINLRRISVDASISYTMFKKLHLTCILWITIGVLAISLPAQSGPVDENEIKKGRECKTFCGSCGCIGFYCGEECICECNEEKNDTECIAAIQATAKRKNIPFEILIQGPSANRFLRNALQFDQNQQQCNKGDSGRTKRSTVVIYKPVSDNSLDLNGFCAKPVDKSVELKEYFRGKRAVTESWFTDFTNTLVKPAPLPGSLQYTEDVEADEEESSVESGIPSAVKSGEMVPKIRGRVRDGPKVGPKSNRKTAKKTDNKVKQSEFETTAKKFRGAITSLRNRAEEILIPSGEDTDKLEASKAAGKTFLTKIRGKIFRTFEDENFSSIS